MRMQVRDGLPYVTVTLLYRGQQLDLANVLLDTGSAGTLFAADQWGRNGRTASRRLRRTPPGWGRWGPTQRSAPVAAPDRRRGQTRPGPFQSAGMGGNGRLLKAGRREAETAPSDGPCGAAP
jgi:hypothetical protein